MCGVVCGKWPLRYPGLLRSSWAGNRPALSFGTVGPLALPSFLGEPLGHQTCLGNKTRPGAESLPGFQEWTHFPSPGGPAIREGFLGEVCRMQQDFLRKAEGVPETGPRCRGAVLGTRSAFRSGSWDRV